MNIQYVIIIIIKTILCPTFYLYIQLFMYFKIFEK